MSALRRGTGPGNAERPPDVRLSFDGWSSLSRRSARVVIVSRPGQTARRYVEALDLAAVETADAVAPAAGLVEGMSTAGTGTLVIVGALPGTGTLLREAAAAGIATRAVVAASPAGTGGDPDEETFLADLLDLAGDGTLGRIGFVKEGVAEAFRAMGVPAAYVPPPTPRLPRVRRRVLDGDGIDVGVFVHPSPYDNLLTQIAAIAMIERGRAHVTRAPGTLRLPGVPLEAHGSLPRPEFVSLLASMDLNLHVPLTASHPATPLESYAAGVPCLVGPTSALFHDDPALRAMTVVDELDNPRAIALAADRLLADRNEAVDLARAWMVRWDAIAGRFWADFVAD